MEIKAGKEYVGIVLPDKDPQNRGRYKVHIPELMPHEPSTNGIWVRNHVHKYRVTRDFKQGTYGQYFPLHDGTVVIVKFAQDNDPTSGYIDRIIYDYDQNQFKKSPYFEDDGSPDDRDEVYLIIKTPKKSHVFVFHEDTQENPNQILLLFNRGRSYVKIDEQGIHVFTEDNKEVTVKKDSTVIIEGNAKLHIKGNTTAKVDGILKAHVSQDAFIWGDSNINIDCAGVINMQCGIAQPLQEDELPEPLKNDEYTTSPPPDLGRREDLFQ